MPAQTSRDTVGEPLLANQAGQLPCYSDKQLRKVGDRQRCSMNLTDEQHAICQAVRDLDVGSSLKIQAFAGTGKTTTLAAIAESLAQRKFLYLVFNRAAADEAEHKMP